jgi:hypothetical protein
MIHWAASRMNCTAVTDTCFQPSTRDHPRVCPARDKGHEGCRCDMPAYALVCCHAPMRDPEARCVYTQRPLRGYDDKGRPVCPDGYLFTANGFEANRLRHNWFCGQACLQGVDPIVRLADVTYPPPECAYQAVTHPHGQVLNIADCFEDKSMRLVRDLPVGTLAWKELYPQGRNAVESRNAAFEHEGLKRMPVFGLPRVKALLFQADVWLNLTTLARLVREATLAVQVT